MAELNTTEPSTEDCMSPMISSSEKSTAAIGVLKAAANAAAQPTGTSALTCLGVSPRIAGDHRGDSRAHLHRGAFAAQRDAAGQSRGATEELAQNGAEGDPAVVDEQREFGLRDAAAAGEREIAPQQVAGGERSQHRQPAVCASRPRRQGTCGRKAAR